MIDITYQQGFPDEFRDRAAQLYDAAFGSKLGLAVPSPSKRHKLLSAGFSPECSFAAFAGHELVGIAGFKTRAGALTGGISARLILRTAGVLGAFRAIPILALYDRQLTGPQLLMDGIAVDPQFRGLGIGTGLLHEIRRFAAAQRFNSVRLDVIDTNPAAKKLYERFGFQQVRFTDLSAVKCLLGFGGVTTMALNTLPEGSPGCQAAGS